MRVANLDARAVLQENGDVAEGTSNVTRVNGSRLPRAASCEVEISITATGNTLAEVTLLSDELLRFRKGHADCRLARRAVAAGLEID